MTHYRLEYRNAVRSALAADPAFSGFTRISAWARDLDFDTLPVFAVMTPSETKDLDSLDGSERVTTLLVVLKLAGGDALEDEMDDLSVNAETCVLRALAEIEREGELTDTEITVDGGGEKRVGTLTMRFKVTARLAEPLTGI